MKRLSAILLSFFILLLLVGSSWAAPVQFGTASKNYKLGARNLVRTSAGVLYFCVLNSTDGKVEMWKDIAGTPTHQDSANDQGAYGTSSNCASAIDANGIINVLYYGSNTTVYWNSYDTATDKWGTRTLVYTRTAASNYFCAITVDAGGFSHAVFNDYQSSIAVPVYANNTSSAGPPYTTWNTPVTILTGINFGGFDIAIDTTVAHTRYNLPQISSYSAGSNYVRCFVGTSNNPTLAAHFTSVVPDQTNMYGYNGTSLIIDSNGQTTVTGWKNSATYYAQAAYIGPSAAWGTIGNWTKENNITGVVTAMTASSAAVDENNNRYYFAYYGTPEIYYAQATNYGSIYWGAEVLLEATPGAPSNISVLWSYGATKPSYISYGIDYLYAKTGTNNLSYNNIALPATIPSVTSTSVTSVLGTTATGNGNVTSNGNGVVSASGFVVNTTGSPSLVNGALNFSGSALSGVFTASMTGLSPSTLYFAKAYATNGGSAYGSEIRFYTPPSIYYVDSINGSNSNDGREQDAIGGEALTGPLLNITGVNALTLAAGDTVRFRCGQVFGDGTLALTISQSGSVGSPITYSAYQKAGAGDPTTLPIICRGAAITGWAEVGTSGVYTSTYAGTSMVWLLEDFISLKKATTNECLNGYWYYDDPGDTIYYKPTTGVPGDHTVTRVFGDSIYFGAGDKSYITFDGLQISGGGVENSATTGLSNIIFKNCAVKHNFNGIATIPKINVDTGPITIQDCIFDYNLCNVYIKASGTARTTCTITRNIITNSQYTGPAASKGLWGATDGDGISTQNLLNSTISYNDISGYCDGASYACGGIAHWTSDGSGATGNVFAYNYIHGIVGAGIINGASDISGTCNTQIYNNIINTFGSGAFAPYGGVRLNRSQTSATPSVVYNNTIYGGDIGIFLYTTPDYYTIKNNIVSNCTVLARANVAVGHNIFTNNDYNGGKTSNPFNYNGTAKNWAYWTGNYGEVNSSWKDPGFANGGGSFALATDFQLSSRSFSSIAKGGADLSAIFSDDYAGTTRTVPWSMGAYEYDGPVVMDGGSSLLAPTLFPDGGNWNPSLSPVH